MAATDVDARATAAGKGSLVQVMGDVVANLPTITEKLRDLNFLGALIQDPSRVGELFSDGSPSAATVAGADKLKCQMYAERECPARTFSGESWQPSAHCIEEALGRLSARRPLAEEVTLTAPEAEAFERIGVTEAMLRTPFPTTE